MRALVSSPCWGSSSQHDRAGGCCHHNSSLSPVRCQGSAACSAATRWSEPASHWPVGGDRMWIPPPQHNKSLHFSSRELMKFLNFPLIWLQWHKAVASLQINKVCESLLPPTYYFSWKTGVNLEEKYLPQICLKAAIPPPQVLTSYCTHLHTATQCACHKRQTGNQSCCCCCQMGTQNTMRLTL